MGLLDDLIEKTKDSIKKKKKNLLEGKEIRQGRTWEQIARDFVPQAKEMFKKYPEGFNISGRNLRSIVGDPRNKELRKWCKEYGVSIKKARKMDIYNIQPFDIIDKRMKDNEKNSSLF